MIAPFGGGVKDGECYDDCLKRELKEELGLHININKVFVICKIESVNSPGKYINIYYVPDIKTRNLTVNEGKGFIELTLDEALNHEKVTEYTKRVIRYYKERNNFAFADDGVLTSSGDYSGLTSGKARGKMTKWLKKNKAGSKKINFKLHDWVLSRQRYWGVPIPMIKCADCGYVPVLEKELPIKLPKLDDFLPTKDGRSPLAKAKKWVGAKCPECGKKAERETDTMDTFVDSSWYFIRYADPKNKKKFADAKKMKKWLPVPMYVGGAEHNTMHLLYSRFFTKALYDLDMVHFNEPFVGRRNHGIILGSDNQKMSKSKGNIVDPDELVKKFGADAVRMYLCFMGPYDQGGPWNPTGILGIKRFLDRIWNYTNLWVKFKGNSEDYNIDVQLNKTIKKVGEDIENFRFNTAISQLMILMNDIARVTNNDMPSSFIAQFISKEDIKKIIILLSPFAPYLSEELWRNILGNKKSIHLESWPKYDLKLIIEEQFELVIQINGKIRDKIVVKINIVQKEAENLALNQEKVKNAIAGNKIKKIIFVPNKLINIVI